MSERERWIVYPLLFLALGAALRDKLSEQTRTRRIECQELIVVSDQEGGLPPVPLVKISSLERKSAGSPHVGQIVVEGGIEARAINADSYYFRRIPFAPTLLKVIPGMLSPEWLHALQQQAEAISAGEADGKQAPPVRPQTQKPPTSLPAQPKQ